MNLIRHQDTSPRILYFGTNNSFSLPPLLALLRAGHQLAGLVIPDNPSHSTLGENTIKLLPTHPNDTIVDRARTHEVPIWSLSHLPVTLEFELLVVACFPHVLPQMLLNRASIAALNIHPSRLPRYRGPTPVFWQLRDGMREIGVTLHHMTTQIDAGDIVAQTSIPLPMGISGTSANTLLATEGANMLVNTINSGDFSGGSQDGPESYQSWPQTQDWLVPTSWSVSRAFNFIRGVAEWGHLFRLLAHPKTVTARSAIDFTHDRSIPGTIRISQSGGHEIGFADGWIRIC